MDESSQQVYTCPMHPEISSAMPGKCPKCGMTLVLVGAKPAPIVFPTEDRGLGFLTWRNYVPLIVIISLILAVALVVSWNDYQAGQFLLSGLISSVMIGFFLVFGAFKLMDIKGFAQGYATYDLFASRAFAYGYAYPFIELAFGLLMLAGFHPNWLLWTELGVMAFSGLGVARKLAQGEKFQCACLGTFLKVPLTYVTLVEDFGMALLALSLILLT